jgi:DNA-binding response OmpR family regulator
MMALLTHRVAGDWCRQMGTHHIVVIDDSHDILLLLRTALEETDWSLAECDDAARALDCVREEQPDVVLLDLRLRDSLSGWDILRKLKADGTTAGVPVILFSADGRALQERAAWLTDQDVGVLTKPFELEDLYGALKSALRVRQGQR